MPISPASVPGLFTDPRGAAAKQSVSVGDDPDPPSVGVVGETGSGATGIGATGIGGTGSVGTEDGMGTIGGVVPDPPPDPLVGGEDDEGGYEGGGGGEAEGGVYPPPVGSARTAPVNSGARRRAALQTSVSLYDEHEALTEFTHLEQ